MADPQRSRVPGGLATAKAIEYTLGRWAALIRYIDDGDLPIDNTLVALANAPQ
jgi:transposase